MNINTLPQCSYYTAVDPKSHRSGTDGNFITIYLSYEWAWKALLTPQLTVHRYNYKCRACSTKIYDDIQIVTSESYNPSYHVNCWKELYKRALKSIMNNTEDILHQIDEDICDVKLTPVEEVYLNTTM